MAIMNRYRVIWTGGPGGSGVSTFYGPDSSTTALAAIRAFFDAVKALHTTQITWSFPPVGDQIDSDTGNLAGTWAAATAPDVVGTSAAAYAAGVGYSVRWETGAIVGTRRVRGRTFMTGATTVAYDNQGTLTAGTVTTITTAASALVTAEDLMVWSRPDGAGPAATIVQAAVVPDKVVWLRTRRQ